MGKCPEIFLLPTVYTLNGIALKNQTILLYAELSFIIFSLVNTEQCMLLVSSY